MRQEPQPKDEEEEKVPRESDDECQPQDAFASKECDCREGDARCALKGRSRKRDIERALNEHCDFIKHLMITKKAFKSIESF